MADKKNIIIIKKKKGGGHGGHHGGAWKVAYADFVTAMMAFFLVMWLMGSDDETKAAISHYFNHPNTPYKNGSDPESEVVNPLGERAGEGESVLSGQSGMNPEDLVPNPSPPESYQEKLKEMAELVNETLDGKATGIQVEEEYLRFSIPESVIFAPRTSHIKSSAENLLDRIGRIIQDYRGHLRIEDFSTEMFIDGREMPTLYEASLLKTLAVTNYLIDHNWFAEERIHPGSENSRSLSIHEKEPHLHPSDRRIQFTLSQRRGY
jgi:chemotaxis protein MotB